METSKKDTVLSVIQERTSVRDFIKDKEVPKDLLENLLKAAMAAPSAVNLQPWQFVAVTERKILDALGDELPYAKMLLSATAAIVVCGDPSIKSTAGTAYWEVDCASATENILLAAEAMGLGSVWTAAYPHEERMRSVRKILQIPEELIPLNVLAIGYAKEQKKPKNKFKPEKIHWNRW